MNWYFITWMLLFPVCISLSGYIESKKQDKKVYSEATEAATGFTIMILYTFVGYALF